VFLGGLLKWHFSGVEVVFADEEYGQVPRGGQVQAFVEGPVIHCAVAEEGYGHLIGTSHLRAKSGPCANQNARRNYAVRCQKANRRLIKVHGPATSAGATIHCAHEFCHDVSKKNSLGQGVAMATMRAGNVVVNAQICTYTHRNRFLADIEVNETGHLAGSENVSRFELELTNLHHAAVERQSQSLRRLHSNLPS